MNLKFLYVAALCLYAAGLAGILSAQSLGQPMAFINQSQPIPGNLSKGAYLAKVGDCISCHSARGKEPYAGGLAINSPFGTIYSTNITPDKEYGIGAYSLQDFSRAVREGIARDGAYLYPAMPYTSFAAASDEDIAALYNYFMHEVKPVHEKSPETKLAFPFSQRWGLRFWDLAFARNKRFAPDELQNTEWNRGAYLVRSLGHCSECHTPRGPAFEVRGTPASSVFLSGEILDNWYAPDLRGDKASGLGGWSAEDIVEFLKSGHGNGVAAFGNMTQVVENSTQYLSDDDLHAIAIYLESLPAGGETSSVTKPAPVFEHNEAPGAGLYAVSCATCHQAEGKGSLPGVPKLAGNSAVLSANPASLIRIVLQGGSSAKTQGGPKSEKMPAFNKLTDDEIAQVLTYLRQSWGNHADAVTTREVTVVRSRIRQ